jgi:protein-tyrosine phosphatase
MPALRWPELRNARDLGGLPARDGHIADRALVRTDNHDRLDPAGIAALDAHGVSRIVDLRWDWEATKYPSPLASDSRYLLRPACFDDASHTQTPPDAYRVLVDLSRDRLGAVIAAMASAPAGGVVVHCHAGRDRTGVVVALALRVAGVPDDVIVEDFAQTPDSPALMMRNTLAHLDAVYGGAEPYLLGGGVTPALLDALRGRLCIADSADTHPRP